MFINNDGRISRNVAGNFFLAFFVYKAAKSANINIVATRHRILNNGKEGFYGGCYIGFIDACLVSDLIDYVCFRHGSGVLGLDFGRTKLICAATIKNNIEKF